MKSTIGKVCCCRCSKLLHWFRIFQKKACKLRLHRNGGEFFCQWSQIVSCHLNGQTWCQLFLKRKKKFSRIFSHNILSFPVFCLSNPPGIYMQANSKEGVVRIASLILLLPVAINSFLMYGFCSAFASIPGKHKSHAQFLI